MEHCILVRMEDGQVKAILGADDEIAVFANQDEAVEAADDHPLCRSLPYQLVCLDEL